MMHWKWLCYACFVMHMFVYAYLHSSGLVVATAQSKQSDVERRTEEPYSKSAGKNAEPEIQIHPWCTTQAPFLLQTATTSLSTNQIQQQHDISECTLAD